jgi:hypothetical protein
MNDYLSEPGFTGLKDCQDFAMHGMVLLCDVGEHIVRPIICSPCITNLHRVRYSRIAGARHCGHDSFRVRHCGLDPQSRLNAGLNDLQNPGFFVRSRIFRIKELTEFAMQRKNSVNCLKQNFQDFRISRPEFGIEIARQGLHINRKYFPPIHERHRCSTPDGVAREKRPFSIDMDALRATNNRFIMIYIISYPELRCKRNSQ